VVIVVDCNDFLENQFDSFFANSIAEVTSSFALAWRIAKVLMVCILGSFQGPPFLA